MPHSNSLWRVLFSEYSNKFCWAYRPTGALILLLCLFVMSMVGATSQSSLPGRRKAITKGEARGKVVTIVWRLSCDLTDLAHVSRHHWFTTSTGTAIGIYTVIFIKIPHIIIIITNLNIYISNKLFDSISWWYLWFCGITKCYLKDNWKNARMQLFLGYHRIGSV